MQWYIGIWQLHIHHMGGWLSPCTAITAYNTRWSGNKAIWARRTKCHSPPYPYYYGNNKLLLNYAMHMWAVPRDSPYCMVVWKMSNYYFMNIFLCYFINTCSKLLPNKYMELNKTKAIAGVPTSGPYSLYNYFTNAHPLISNKSKRKNNKIWF